MGDKGEEVVKMNGSLKQTQTAFSATKITEKTVEAKTSVTALNNTYPEIEKFFPSRPLEFESFSLPEQHQIARLLFNGVPLIILDNLKSCYTAGPPYL